VAGGKKNKKIGDVQPAGIKRSAWGKVAGGAKRKKKGGKGRAILTILGRQGLR